MDGRRVRALVLQVVGVVLAALGVLAAVVFVLSSLDHGSVVGGVVLSLVSLLVALLGLLMARGGSRRMGASGPTTREWAFAHARPLLVTGFGLLAVASAAIGLVQLGSDEPATAGAGVLLAFVPFLVASVVLVEVVVRGASRRLQWVVMLCGLAGAAVVLLVVGITAEDARQLVVYGVVCGVAATGAAGRAVSRRES